MRLNQFLKVFLLLGATALSVQGPQDSYAGIHLTNSAQLRKAIGLDKLQGLKDFSKLKIAILDNGFMGYTKGSDGLPADTVYISKPSPAGAIELPTPHGLVMAQTVWGLLERPASGPTFILINSNGFTNFQAAVQTAIEKDVDIILYSQTWEYGGNFDGRGFINKTVQKALDAGITWVNCAGDHHGTVVNKPIVGSKIKIPFTSSYDNTDVTVTLSWDDFTEDPNYKTRDDLDIDIVDSNGTLVAAGSRVQRGEDPTTTEPNLSAHGRERFRVKLNKGIYTAVVKVNTLSLADRFRLVIYPDNKLGSIKIENHRISNAEIMIPADHRGVIAVGDKSPVSAKGPTADGRLKPDLLLPVGGAEFSDGSKAFGTSISAALYAGSILELMAVKQYKNAFDAWKKVNQLKAGPCLKEEKISAIPFDIEKILQQPVQAAKSSFGQLLAVIPVEPESLPTFSEARNRGATSRDYRFYLTPASWWVEPIASTRVLPWNYIQVIEENRAPRLCGVAPLWKL